ncbi:sialidase family protein [Brachyspira sp. SAP_772]|uniref:sialidase family protein n=1 Tax=Brachyspira sp. SAP_772 TaxID=2608385 RepID=UPI0012F4F55E|nr:sialidase family protein [Brachyspira sp. SAP_772]
MSKKIIYLLFLVVALILAFASCKKDNGLNPTVFKSNPNKEEVIKTNTGGLYKDWDSIKDLTVIQDFPVIDESKSDKYYYRNPIIVSLVDNAIIMIIEKRIGFKGSENDIGINGEGPVDIVYSTSFGGDYWTPLSTFGNNIFGDSSTGADDAVSSPIVYYKKPSSGNTTKMYIIASAGAGLSRTDTAYSNRNPQSKLKYFVCDIYSSNKDISITWKGDWKELTITDPSLSDIQFGTHSARGVFISDNKLVLPIITADLGVNNNIKDAMGVKFFEIQISADKNTLTMGNQIGTTIEFDKDSSGKFSMYKEVEAVAYDTDKVTYLAVPNPSRNNYTMGKGDSSSQTVTALTGLKGSEGSFGFLKINNGWYGAQEYNPNAYASNPSTAGNSAGSTVSTAILFSHVASKVGKNYLYILNSDYTPKGGGLQIAKTSKSSSIDILSDGTIIMATEKERNPNVDGNKFSIFFSRYTQKYLAENIK